MEKRWTAVAEADPIKVAKLAEELKINTNLLSLFVQRGILCFDQAKEYCNPNFDQLHDPFLMKDMDIAVKLLGSALENQKKILIYGDYDVDGTSAVALVYSFLLKYEARVEFYIPDRNKEGYGVSDLGMQYAIANQFDLLITLDCGIKALNTLKTAKDAGLDIIVCDHHLPGATLPPADAILNPKQADCAYPFKELCGCGVGFKLLQALVARYELEFELLWQQLDLVAIATAADIVPMQGENRVLAALGLQVINSNPRPGVAAVFKSAKKENEKDINDLVFTVAPRINAAGRLDHGKEAVKLLSREDAEAASNLAFNLNELNATRRDLDRSIAEEALQQILERGLPSKKTTVVYDPNWNKGVVGIVASRLTETYYRPTIVLCKSEDKVTGSVRSVKDFDVHDALCDCADLLEQFGGHKYAAGLSMKEENYEAFCEKFEEVVSRKIDPELLIPVEYYDLELDLNEIDHAFYSSIKRLAPFGPLNNTPQFLFKGVVDTGYAKLLGVGREHLKFQVTQQGTSVKFDAIAFKMAHHYDLVKSKKPFQMIASIEENHWNGRVSLQLMVKDIKPFS